MLGLASFSPLFVAVLICWILSVCVHEYAHAVVAYWGGDRSVKEKGYLSFNIFAFINPVTSILIPCLFLIFGGVPLPGGAVQINERALRSRHWSAAVSAAGPAANFLLFLVLAVLVHPSTGLVDPNALVPPPWAMLLGAMAVLQLFSVFFNLLPIPPLDGFGIIEPYLAPEVREKARRLGWWGLIILFFLFSRSEGLMKGFMDLVDVVLQWFGLPWRSTWRYYNIALFGSSE